MKEINWTVMNEEQANTLFAKHAMLIGSADRVPYYVAVELFGDEAAWFGAHKKNDFYGAVEISGNAFYYLTKDGFKACISYLNCMACMEANNAQQAKDAERMCKDDEREEVLMKIIDSLHPECTDICQHELDGTATTEEMMQLAQWTKEADAMIGDEDPAEVWEMFQHGM